MTTLFILKLINNYLFYIDILLIIIRYMMFKPGSLTYPCSPALTVCCLWKSQMALSLGPLSCIHQHVTSWNPVSIPESQDKGPNSLSFLEDNWSGPWDLRTYLYKAPICLSHICWLCAWKGENLLVPSYT